MRRDDKSRFCLSDWWTHHAHGRTSSRFDWLPQARPASTITGLGDLLNTFFVTLLVAPFLVIWGTMVLGIGWIAEASRRVPETLDDVEEERNKEKSRSN
jgi:hypothetical protein